MALPDDIELIPPVEPRTVYRAMALALTLIAVPAILGLIELVSSGIAFPAFVSTLRILLTGLAAVVGAIGLSLRAQLPLAWVLAAAVAFGVSLGLPAHWDSIQMLNRVLAVIALLGGALVALPVNWRYGLLSAAAMIHFGAILVAVTWPEPAPWLSNQLAGRFYMPYYRFMYLGNAYHFYSPEPGPANHLFALVQFQVDGKEKPEFGWIDIPNRRDHFKDPLGMTYYRRLSLTELVSQSTPASGMQFNYAKLQAQELRKKATVVSENGSKMPVPLNADIDPIDIQYRVAYTQLRGQTLPSYAKHIASEYETPAEPGKPGRHVVSVKLFRVEHRVIPAQAFLDKYDDNGNRVERGTSPFHPVTYRPYYLGEYNPAGELTNPLDPMLYWLVPIVPRKPLNENEDAYIDYMSDYAGAKFPWGLQGGAP